jgi:hypothetical protein
MNIRQQRQEGSYGAEFYPGKNKKRAVSLKTAL